MFTLFHHGPAAGAAGAHGEFESVEAAEAFLARPEPFQDALPFMEGSPLYLVSEDNTQIWAQSEESIDLGVEKFYNASNESWAAEQIELLRRAS